MEAHLKPILLIGESCVDVCVYGDITRLNPEAPSPVMSYEHEHRSEGMSANVRANIFSLSNNNVSVRHIHNEVVLEKTRFIDKRYGYILLRVDKGDTVPPCESEKIKKLCRELKNREYSALVISDYNKGFLSATDIKLLAKAARSSSTFSFIDTKKTFSSELSYCDVAKINELEYRQNNWESAANPFIVRTVGEQGSDILEGGQNPRRITTDPAAIVNAAGAGDTFFAGLVIHWLWSQDVTAAVRYANRAARVAVSKSGVVAVNHWEVADE